MGMGVRIVAVADKSCTVQDSSAVAGVVIEPVNSETPPRPRKQFLSLRQSIHDELIRTATLQISCLELFVTTGKSPSLVLQSMSKTAKVTDYSSLSCTWLLPPIRRMLIGLGHFRVIWNFRHHFLIILFARPISKAQSMPSCAFSGTKFTRPDR
jgi:hypothetical protein